uniref:Candidate secreted effector n=1 Tax=Meloidogyne incognita TaxID=6306 RepID=A0A914KJB1_MELIC
MNVFILIFLFVPYSNSAETASEHGNELNKLDFSPSEDISPSPSEESLDSQSSDEEFFDSSSSSEDVGPSDNNSQKYKEPYIAKKEYSINDLLVEFEVHVDVQQACFDSTKFLSDLFGNQQEEFQDTENGLKLKNETILKLFKASEAIVGEIKNLIVEFEKVFDKELKGEKKYYKNREEKSLPENLFCESLPNYVIAGLFDKKYKATRTRLFDKFLSKEDNKETRWKSVKKALRKHKAVEKQTALEKQNSLKTEYLKKQKSLEKQRALENQKALEKALEQKALENQRALEKQEALEKQKSLRKQNSLKQKFLKKQESLSLKNCKLNWGDVIKFTTKLNDICKVFKQKKDVDSLLLTKMDRFYFNFEDRKNLRKLNR